MENQTNDTIETQTKAESAVQQNQVLMNAFALQVADQVLSNIERVQLKTVAFVYDLKKIRALLVEFKELKKEESEITPEAEQRFLEELNLWRLSLTRRDEIVKTFHLRRFYEQNLSSVTPQMLSGLGCFYRHLTPSFEVRCKYDFVLTQLFTSKQPDKPRFVKISSNELINRLQKMNDSWIGVENDRFCDDSLNKRLEAITIFESLRSEVTGFSTLEDLLKSNFFNRVRRHKQYLGDIFFAPEVTAASILCNVAVGNKFAQLAAEENEHFKNYLEAEHGNSDLLNLILEDNPAQSVTLLKKINPTAGVSDNVSDFEPIENVETGEAKISLEIWSSVESDRNKPPQDSTFSDHYINNSSNKLSTESEAITSSPADEGFLNKNASELPQKTVAEFKARAVGIGENSENPAENIDSSQPENVAFLPVLSEIAKRKPQETLLRVYLAASSLPEVRDLELSHYLQEVEFSENGENDLKRRALRLIFIAEESRRKLQNDVDGSLCIEEINALKSEMQSLSTQLRLTISTIAGENKKERCNVLLVAANNLFEARLRLKTAFTKSEDVHPENHEDFSDAAAKVLDQAKRRREIEIENRKAAQNEAVQEIKPLERKPKKTGKIDRKLIVATVLVLLFGSAYPVFLANTEQYEIEKTRNSDVKTIDVRILKGGENLVVGRISNETLIGIVNDDWKNVPADKKRESLQTILRQGSQYQFKTVLLLNASGKTIGNATPNGIEVE